MGTDCCGFTPDPSTDYDNTNMMAGVVVGGGGIAPVTLHPMTYLTSPVIDLTVAAGPVYLTFYRWLNADYPPFSREVVEASNDGTTWVTIWSSQANTPTADGSWVFVSYDITAYKSATTRFRMGHAVESAGAYSVGS